MPRTNDTGHLNIAQVFHRLQHDLSAGLALSSLIEHAVSAGTAAEHCWVEFLNAHLPSRYRATPAFIIDAQAHRSRQIDIAIYDHLHAAPLLSGTGAVHLPVETVQAVFEVKPDFSRQLLLDAALKADSVRALKRRTRRRLHAGLLAKASVWNPETFSLNLRRVLRPIRTLDLGCSLDHGSFNRNAGITISDAPHSLQFFLYSLLTRLDPKAPAPDLSHYWKIRRTAK